MGVWVGQELDEMFQIGEIEQPEASRTPEPFEKQLAGLHSRGILSTLCQISRLEEGWWGGRGGGLGAPSVILGGNVGLSKEGNPRGSSAKCIYPKSGNHDKSKLFSDGGL